MADLETGTGEVRVEPVAAPAASPEPAPAAPAATEPAPKEPAAATSDVSPTAKVTQVPPYQPNFKLKVMDQEKEIPEEFRSLIKDADTEKKVREVFEKAYGLDFAKPKHEAVQQTLTQLQAEHNYVLGSVQEAKELYQRGDLDGFFEKLAIPPQRILQYAMEKLHYQELPPDQKALIDARRTAERQNLELQKTNATYQRQMQEQVVQARQFALNTELARSDVKSIADTFDQRAGKPGAFMREVINRGQLAWFQSQGKVDLTPGQAIEQVIQLYGLQATQAQPAGASVTPPASGGQQKVTTIPNVGSGKSAAPLKQKFKSIVDLKKYRDKLINE